MESVASTDICLSMEAPNLKLYSPDEVYYATSEAVNIQCADPFSKGSDVYGVCAGLQYSVDCHEQCNTGVCSGVVNQ